MNGSRRQSWVEDWQSGPWEFSEEKLILFRRQPEGVQNVMLQFPPLCLVRANRVLKCPSPGTVGIVTGYFGPSEPYLEGAVTVRQSPKSSVRHKCRPGWLEIVGYHRGLSPSVLSALILVGG